MEPLSRPHSEFLTLASHRELGRLTTNVLGTKATEMIKLRTADYASLYEVDLGNTRRVEREDTLNTNTIGDLADGERLVEARTATRDHDTFEVLDTLLVTLDDANGHVHGITCAKFWYILTNLCAVNSANDLFHGLIFLYSFVAELVGWCSDPAIRKPGSWRLLISRAHTYPARQGSPRAGLFTDWYRGNRLIHAFFVIPLQPNRFAVGE